MSFQEKKPEIFPYRAFLFRVLDDFYRSALIPWKLPCPEKFLVMLLGSHLAKTIVRKECVWIQSDRKVNQRTVILSNLMISNLKRRLQEDSIRSQEYDDDKNEQLTHVQSMFQFYTP